MPTYNYPTASNWKLKHDPLSLYYALKRFKWDVVKKDNVRISNKSSIRDFNFRGNYYLS